MGNASAKEPVTPPPAAKLNKEEQARLDTKLSDAPLFVVYGSQGCGFSQRAVALLEKRHEHHCKIGTDLLGAVRSGDYRRDGLHATFDV